MVDFKDPVLMPDDCIQQIGCISNHPAYPYRKDLYVSECFTENAIHSAMGWIRDHRNYEYLRVTARIYNKNGLIPPISTKLQVLYERVLLGPMDACNDK